MKKVLALYIGLLLLSTSCNRIRQSDSLLQNDSVEEIENLKDPENQVVSAIPEVIMPATFSSAEQLMSYINSSEDSAAYQEGIIPEIAQYSIKYASKLMHNEYPRFIIVDKGRMKVILYDKYGREEKCYGMACAKNFGSKHKKADSRTPEGFFSVEGKYDSTDWLFTDDNGVTSPKKGQFGPRFIRLKTPVTYQIGIHGTVAPWSIGGRVSHGCIRITNENILELVDLVEVGMPVIVVPGRRDMIVNKEEDFEVDWIPSIKGAKAPNIPKVIPKKDKDNEEEKADKSNAVTQDTIVNSESEDLREVSKPVAKPDSVSASPFEGSN